MSPSTGMARFPKSRLATLSFVKNSMCSHEKPGWPGYQDLGLVFFSVFERRQRGRVIRAPDLMSGGSEFEFCSDH